LGLDTLAAAQQQYAILAEDVPPSGILSMAVTVSEDSVGIRLEPLRNRDLRATLLDGKVPAGAEGRCIDVCLLLRSLVDDYSIGDLSGDAYAVEILKHIGQ